ncbi:2-oxoglutarate dehydrogenase complex dihydrolipoyllysine-residue succinyltransferase [Pseudobacteriovorax antillogorgiicola]|uniref:Dihydrolipoyllysine-residue succinyltransferase component of 2-oxoglutarate dehydrogenase complex n=1 Tax=Pseudobacteriovorax antillogorgiicola TaxID=1513793 RepID=A0A1Y6B3I1_9BACT|nr:2-oxoglutarate dehydrogenase complex dihydrolipoyllysine-residue succinyltransferase [Pseudobacteriovorax antillogorgiicola]TCS59459.1 2-oxoglutarate dehydrogenase E2 component [Pseudobacteriovorax antillogorgiicola]SME88166.1 2-oxoglutarate dehydrogenase E2 component [Pseudobacteriovorax antillogorgiicola]
MAFEVRVPAVGESVQEGEIYKWHKSEGDYVELDDVLVELETDKATVEIVAEASGVISLKKAEGDTVTVGDLLASIDTSASKPAGGASEAKKEEKKDDVPEPSSSSSSAPPPPPPPPAQKSQSSQDDRPQSPAVSRMVKENNIDSSQISGSGRGGRITKDDVVNHLQNPPQPQQTSSGSSASSASSDSGERGVRREKMSRLRQRIAERLVEAQHNAAMLTTFNEVDMSAVMNLRKQYKEDFKETHGVGLGFMSFFVKAAVEALKAYPAINGYVDGTDVVYHDYYDIGIAVSTNRGLMVPVVRNCDKLDFPGVESEILSYAKKGRDGKISLDDLSGGTFTISNGGVFGSLLSTPILNPPQSAILGMHKIQERPMVVNGEIVVRPMMYLALSYDHRIVDGKEAVSFLVKIKENIEDPARLLLGV